MRYNTDLTGKNKNEELLQQNTTGMKPNSNKQQINKSLTNN